MKRLPLALLVFLLAGSFRTHALDAQAVLKLFAHPPREYATAPLWVWNDMLTEDEIRSTLRDLAGQEVKQAFVHPRPGLMTPYLSPEWFRLWKVALDEAAKLDMNVWIYDENSYPSGFAGGWVPELMPESRGLGLSLREAASPPKWDPATLAVFQLEGGKADDISSRVRAGESLPDGRYLVASLLRAPDAAWTANHPYVNLLTPGVTEKFIEVTLGAYQREIGAQFGQRVPGVFTDEPNIRPAGGLPWCDDLPQQFEKRRGYSLLESLPSLSHEVGDWRKIRHNYFSLLNDLFVQRWAKPYYEWCGRHGLEFTGHYWDHEWPNCIGVPDNMAMYAWHQRPAIDCLMNQYSEQTHGQFGNLRMPRELSSVANQLGRQRTLVELYGAGGWDLRFEDMKRIADWLQVLGVNTMDEHLSYVTLRGARKRDHPQSFSYHEPWWEAYHVSASYLTRLSCALSQGQQINRVLVLEPTTTAWMYQGNEARLGELGTSFFKLLMSFETAQVEYDLACEDILAREGSVHRKELQVGRRSYPLVVLPPGVENLNSRTAELLAQFHQSGGTVLALGPKPSRIEGQPRDLGPSLTAGGTNWILADPIEAAAISRQWSAADGFEIRRSGDDPGILFHHRRQIDDGQILFLVNTSITSPSTATLESDQHGVAKWDLATGRNEPYPFEMTEQGVKAGFRLPPSGSLLLFLSKERIRPPKPPAAETDLTMTLPGLTEVRRLEPNVLTLDYVDITAGGETRSNQYFYIANRFAWQKNGMQRDPWDSAVQFKDDLITRTFPADSGFTASYRFTIEGPVPKNLEIVIERPDLYTITCNGQPVRATPREWWLDKAFGRIPLSRVAQTGENIVTAKAQPFTMYHELESSYLRGDFVLKPANQGFVITPDQPLRVAAADRKEARPEGSRLTESAGLGWNEQGHPFYSAGVAYRRQFDARKPAGRYFVGLPRWYGSVARVEVNGRVAGYISAPPWECEITHGLKRGKNTIEVVVIGTLKNTLGPHHGSHPPGSAWPGMFQEGPSPGPPPGAQYSTISYGLFEPFVIRQVQTRRD